MNGDSPFAGPPEDTREEILRAAFLVLQRDGYGGLSMNRIAEEVGLQKASVYHHYAEKDTLLLALVDYVVEELRYRIVQSDDEDPLQQLRRFIDEVVFGHHAGSDATALSPPTDGTIRAFIQIRAQAVHDDDYREQITTIDRIQQEHIAEIIQRGVDAGEFRDVDPTQVASFISTLLTGVFTRRVTMTTDLTPVREATHAYLEAVLVA
ncbi:TetR/AcrR family transcriptional regulator [Halobacterium salinarum]|uniref:TetR/AcrR family transcriptional regulator n=1 Tax=Halobacterium salinarum TaxID=2242 RepID=UPI002552B0D5|nr:TetR/AcrR family transcriptional regulator [Halobacterium salinarum]MDL0119310.1 TetR/AcrR family transcriptional regulator [Halobacterium salinarum]